jgi:hypothetical protein
MAGPPMSRSWAKPSARGPDTPPEFEITGELFGAFHPPHDDEERDMPDPMMTKTTPIPPDPPAGFGADGELPGHAMATPAVAACCHLHRPTVWLRGAVVDRCCDPNDCGPCCADCPTCPELVRRRVPTTTLAEHTSDVHEEIGRAVAVDRSIPLADVKALGMRAWDVDALIRQLVNLGDRIKRDGLTTGHELRLAEALADAAALGYHPDR